MLPKNHKLMDRELTLLGDNGAIMLFRDDCAILGGDEAWKCMEPVVLGKL